LWRFETLNAQGSSASTKVEADMNANSFFRGAAFLATAAALAAPAIADGRKPGPPETPYVDARSVPVAPPGSTGWGKGSITLPAGEGPGLLVGLVTQCDDACRYVIEAELTGFMPSTQATSNVEYWFGGVYGRLQEHRLPAPGEKEVPWLRVEGVWYLDKDFTGTFSAEVYGCNEAGIEYVCGRIYSRFNVSEAMPGPAPEPCRKDFAVPPIRKEKWVSGLPYRGAAPAGGTITCPKGPDYVAAEPRPVKATPGTTLSVLRPYADAADTTRRKTGGVYWQGPCKAGWRDARSTHPAAQPYATPPPPCWPILSGTFDLRYRLYE
jgi:hypothetical protein